MKLIHSSDLLIGACFAQAYDKADDLRSARLGVLTQLFERVKREKAQILLLAGNTLADNRVAQRDLKQLSGELKNSPVPVLLLPGLTDPLTADSPYRRYPELFSSPIHILQEPFTLEGVTFHPCPVRSRRQRPVWQAPSRLSPDEILVGVACTSEPVDPGELDYLALGGRAVEERGERFAWSGAPEALDYGQGRGSALLVTLTGGAGPQLKSLEMGSYRWYDNELQLKSIDRLRDELEGIKNPTVVLQRLTVRGALSLPELRDVHELLQDWESRMFHLRVEDQIVLLPDQEEYFREHLVRQLVRCLEATPNARKALLELYALEGSCT